MTQKLITDTQLDGIAGSKVSGAVALATTVTTNANLSGDVTSVGNTTTLGTVPVAKGGTNITSYTTGDLPYASATNVLSKLGVGTTGQVLTIAGGVPSWATPAGMATWGSITGTLSSQTDLQTVLDGKADEVSPSLSGTITLANFTKTTGDYSTYTNRPYFQTNTGTGTFVTSVGPSTATSSGAYFSGIASSDITASNFFAVGASQSATTPFAFYFGSTTSGTPTYADPTVAIKFIGRGSLTTYATINPSTAASASTDLTRLSDITVTNLSGTVPVAKGGSGQTTANDALNAFLPSQATNNGKVLGTDGTNTSWVTAGGGSGTVTSVSVVTANGVSGSVANATTTPAITLTLGAITPSSVASTGTVTGTNLSGTNTGDQTITLTGDVTGSGTGSFATTLGTVPATKGGTGQTTITTGDVLYGSAANTISKLGIGSAGQVLTVAGGVPTWAAAGGGGATLKSYKEAVRVASTHNATITTAFANGQVLDGVTLVTGDRILIKSQTMASANGIYTVNASGSPTRAADFDTNGAEVENGAIIPVSYGTRFGGTIWTLTSGGGAIGNNFIFTPVNGQIVQGMTAPPVTTGTNAIAMGNDAQAANSSMAIGTASRASGLNGIGIGNSADGSSDAISIGNSAIANGNAINSVALGHSTSVTHCLAISLGREAVSSNQCAFVLGLGYFAAPGDAAIITQQGWMTTTNATPTTLGIATNFTGPALTNPTGFIALSNDSSYFFDCNIVARNTATDTESAMYNLKFGIRRGAAAANTAIVGSPVLTVIGQDTGTTTWNVAVTADTTNGRPSIQVTGQASKTIRWLANISITKVSG